MLEQKIRSLSTLPSLCKDVLRVVTRQDGNPFSLTRLLSVPDAFQVLLQADEQLGSDAFTFLTFGILQFRNPMFTEDAVQVRVLCQIGMKLRQPQYHHMLWPAIMYRQLVGEQFPTISVAFIATNSGLSKEPPYSRSARFPYQGYPCFAVTAAVECSGCPHSEATLLSQETHSIIIDFRSLERPCNHLAKDMFTLLALRSDKDMMAYTRERFHRLFRHCFAAQVSRRLTRIPRRKMTSPPPRVRWVSFSHIAHLCHCSRLWVRPRAIFQCTLH